MVGGRGLDGMAIKSTWIFEMDNKTWKKGPELMIARLDHGCAKFYSSYHGTSLVAAMGGMSKDSDCVGISKKNCKKALDSVELIDSKILKEWKFGKWGAFLGG